MTRSIAREHVLGATIWAYGAGGVNVRAWTHHRRFSRLRRRTA
ncbi:hypothetical protein [Salarchaeum japonicum]|nr:hypothetical protein [Salarchaeum japonicum]